MVMGECSDCSSLGGLNGQGCQLSLWVGSNLVLTDFHSEDPKWTLAYGFVLYMIAS